MRISLRKVPNHDGPQMNSNTPESMTAEEITALYFEQLDEEDVRKLFRIFEPDFLMFGYSFAFKGKTYPPGGDKERC